MVQKYVGIYLLMVSIALVKSAQLSGILRDFVEQDFVKLNISAKCEQNLLAIRRGIRDKQIWALKLLDASGQPPADFIYGNNYFSGSPRTCSAANSKFYTAAIGRYNPISYANLTVVTSPFPVAYRAVHARHYSKMQIDSQTFDKHVLDFGFCLPTNCTDSDSEKIFKVLIRNDSFTSTTLIGSNVKFIETKLLRITSEYFDNIFVQLFITITLIMLLFIGLQLFYEIFKKYFRGDEDEKSKQAFWEKFLNCFSICENFRTIVQRDVGINGIKVLHGLKALSMNIIILGHLAIFASASLANYSHALIYPELEWVQPIHMMHLSVETFYVISATLFAHVFFKVIKDHGGTSRFLFGVKATLVRYVRLTPPYVIQILMAVSCDRLLKQISPYYLVEDNEKKCAKKWWHNIIYINNFTPLQTNCIISSYFLSTDFQLFLISLVLLLLLNSSFQLGLVLTVCVVVLSIIFSGYYGFIHLGSFSFTEIVQTVDIVYTPFYIHVLSYLPGIATGWFLCYKEKTLPLSKNWIWTLWTLTVVILFCVPFVHILQDISPYVGLAYTVLIRFLWCSCISWIIIACETGNGGFLGKILASRLLRPFSRLSYSAYLVHPILIHLVSMLLDFPHRFEFSMTTIYAAGAVVSINLGAVIFLFLFEAPFVRLCKLII